MASLSSQTLVGLTETRSHFMKPDIKIDKLAAAMTMLYKFPIVVEFASRISFLSGSWRVAKKFPAVPAIASCTIL